jgi:archaellum component FlaC
MNAMGNSASPHDRYAELCALATSGTLSAAERQELESHLATCADCHEAYRQYFSVATEVIPVLAQDYEVTAQPASWDNRKAGARLFAQVAKARLPYAVPTAPRLRSARWPRLVAAGALAACLLVGISVVAYRAGKKAQPVAAPTLDVAVARLRVLDAERQSLQQQLTVNSAAVEKLQAANAGRQDEIYKLDAALQATESRLAEVNASDSSKTQQLQALSRERDSLAQQLRGAQQSYKTVEEELNTLRDQRSQGILRAASLESEVQRLSDRVREQDGTLRDHEQYLAANRDIRELMGARQLYIADVFDVDKNGNKRKPFGRVFYTKEKSLIFYAFDLDKQPGVKNASIFQAWGLRDANQAKPVNLGILYMDNEAKRRWVLQFDDPNKLAEIDAVFVTVEPRGGSDKPTGKPLLYASLRKLPNHP